MRRFWAFFVALLVLIPAGTAYSQDQRARAGSRPHAAGAAVAFAELDGLVAETTTVLEQVVRREGKEFPVRNQNDARFVFGPGEQIDWTLTVTSTSPRGTRTAQPINVKGRLGRPGEARNMGGGHGVWVFENGTLTSLRIYVGGGGFRREVAFSRSTDGFACTITEGYVREDGTGPILLESPVDGVPTMIVGAKQTSSSCRVHKPVQ